MRGAQWLLDQYRESIEQRSVSAQSLFSSGDPVAELERAKREIPETIPVFACYGLLPLIPTGLALRVLIITGYADDPRVEASFNSLLRLGDQTCSGDGVSMAGMKSWCSHSCMNLLQKKKRSLHGLDHRSFSEGG
jgi:hypothetical protein